MVAFWWPTPSSTSGRARSEEHTSELQSRQYLVCRLLLEKKKAITIREWRLPAVDCLILNHVQKCERVGPLKHAPQPRGSAHSKPTVTRLNRFPSPPLQHS